MDTPRVSLLELAAWMDEQLQVAEMADYQPAHNGLQLENTSGRVARVVSAVDACEASLEQAIAVGADLLIVHHGLFWNGAAPWTGARFRKLKKALEGGLAIYSAHLPLDVHFELGNNALLARALGFGGVEQGNWEGFLPWKGLELGLKMDLGGNLTLGELVAKVETAVDGKVHVCAGGPSRVGTLGIATGGAGSEVEAAAAAGVDTFVTGEGPHWSYPLAEELGVNLLYAGHYQTETFGVRALAEALCGQFGLENRGFWPHPTGL